VKSLGLESLDIKSLDIEINFRGEWTV